MICCWLKVIEMSSMTSEPTIDVGSILFPMAYQSSWLQTKGPCTLIEFAEFLLQSAIKHILTVPFHQSSNSTVEWSQPYR